MWNRIVPVFLIILIIVIFIQYSSDPTQNVSFNSIEVEPVDYFDFYRIERDKAFQDKQIPIATSVSLLNAYEFDNEYSIVHINSEITGAQLWCRYFSENLTEISKPIESFTFPQYLVNCPRVKGTVKISLSVSKSGTYDYPINLINRSSKIRQKHELSMCMSPIYGKEPKWLLLSELVEHYKIQGVTKFYFYVYQIDEYSRAILEDYERTGEVFVVNLLERYDRELMHWQIVAFRDCQLRARFESRWVLFSDLDERITMTGYNGTILDYMKNLKNPEKIGAVIFRQRWILKTETMPQKYINSSHLLQWMPTLRWHNTSSVGPPGHTVKTIADPRKVYEAWTHYPRIYYPGDHQTHDVRPEDGIVRHYRDQQMWNWGKTWLKEVLSFGPLSLTNYSERYQSELVENVVKRVEYVYSNYHIRLD